MFDPIDITVTDPREFDGNPYEVAQRALAQASGVLRAYSSALSVAFLMARNADMERNLALGLPPAGDEYLSGPQGRKFTELHRLNAEAMTTLKTLEKAAGFDPKHPAR